MINTQRIQGYSGNKKILIIYHSGSGSTRTISEIFKEKLSKLYEVYMIQVNPDFNYQGISDSDYLLFGFPTYHCEPSTSMLEFVEKIPLSKTPKKAFVFTTCGLYTGNCLRILIKKLIQKNIFNGGDKYGI